jgi:hypothetical protein
VLTVKERLLLHARLLLISFSKTSSTHILAYQSTKKVSSSYVFAPKNLKQTIVTRLTNGTKSDKFSSIKDLMIQKDGKLFAAENVAAAKGNYLQSENFLSHF